MKILLIFPRYKYPSCDPPLGISYVASFIREKTDVNVEIIDTTFHDSYSKLMLRLKRSNYDLIGIYADVVSINNSLKVAKISKIYNPDALVVIAGPFPTIEPDKALKYDYVDVVVVGEGEQTFYELIKNELNFENVKGILYKKNGKIRKNGQRNFIENLDEIPFPARDLLPMKKYIRNWYQLDIVSPNLKGTHIIASRGCPYNCSYCQPTLRKIFGPKLRFRTPQNILEELLHLKEKYNINAFTFEDDTFIINQKWVERVCNELIKCDLDLFWGCNVRADLVNKPLLEKMKKAGLVKIYIGIETPNERILRSVYNKQITLKQIKDSVKIANSLGLKIQGYFMLGAPTEMIKDIKKTIDFAKSLKIDEAMFSITTPLPGTYLFERFGNEINDFENFDYYSKYTFSDLKIKRFIIHLKRMAYLKFYLSKERIFSTIKMNFNPLMLNKNLMKLKRF